MGSYLWHMLMWVGICKAIYIANDIKSLVTNKILAKNL